MASDPGAIGLPQLVHVVSDSVVLSDIGFVSVTVLLMKDSLISAVLCVGGFRVGFDVL